jgi:diguanylate cyclase (GGDEF)-like protein
MAGRETIAFLPRLGSAITADENLRTGLELRCIPNPQTDATRRRLALSRVSGPSIPSDTGCVAQAWEAATSDSTQKRIVTCLAGFSLIFGCVSLALLRRRMPLASALFSVAYLFNAGLSGWLCFRRSLRSPHLKVHWALLSAASGSGLVVAIVGLLKVAIPLIANFATFFIFCTYIPAFLLISLPAGRRYFHHFLWLDLAQTVIAMYVGYAILFQARPFTHDIPSAIGGEALFRLFMSADFIILAGAFLHVLTAVNKDEMRFYRLLSLFNLLGMAAVYVHHVFLLRNPQETLTSIPVLLAEFLAILLILHSAKETSEELPAQSKGLIADLINIASPALPSATLLALGMIVENRFQTLGRVAVITAFIVFVARATIYHKSFEALHHHLEDARAGLERLSYTDGLTGVANRRALEKALNFEWEHSLRSGCPLSFLLVDVDFFKQVNDQHGHRTGDQYLIAISGALSCSVFRSIDVVGRYGGDEFAVVLPSSDVSAAEVVAERLCHEVRKLRIENCSSSTGFATISVGIATCLAFREPTPGGLLSAADAALYTAKRAGRNCWRSERLPLEENGSTQE